MGTKGAEFHSPVHRTGTTGTTGTTADTMACGLKGRDEKESQPFRLDVFGDGGGYPAR